MSYERAVELREAGDADGITALARAHPEDARIWILCAWTHDRLGLEAEAVEFYEGALRLGLPPEDAPGAYLGLGSTLRCLDRLNESLATFDAGLAEFPDDRALKVFRALTLYSLGQARDSVRELLVQLLETTDSPRIQAYRRALTGYANELP